MGDEIDDLLTRGERDTTPAPAGGDDLDALLARGESKVDMGPDARRALTKQTAPGLAGNYGITGQHPGMLEAGNIDLTNRPDVANADGSHSSVRSMSFEDKGKEVLVPTVSEDGRIMSDDEAINQYRRTGRHLGKFANPEAATAYAEALHNQQAAAMPSTRRPPLAGMRPAPKSDEELGLNEGPVVATGRDIRRTMQGRNDAITTPEAREKRDARARREDVIANDPLAGMIAQGLPAAGLTTVLAPFTGPMVAGAAGGAAASPDDPLTGAILGAIPGAPGAARTAARAADEAIGRKAVALGERGAGEAVRKAGKAAGTAVGAAAGHSAAGFVGAGVGAGIGGKLGSQVAGKLAPVADRLAKALADRQLARDAVAAARTAPSYAPPPAPSAAAARGGPIIDIDVPHTPAPPAGPAGLLGPVPPPRAPLAPLTPAGPALPTRVPPGAMGTPFLDEISGEPVTRAGQGGFLPEEAVTNAGAKPSGAPPAPAARPLRLKILDENGRDLTADSAKPSLFHDVRRDVQGFRDQPYDIDPAAEGAATPETAAMARPDIQYSRGPSAASADVGGQIDQTVQVLNLMKQAKEAGTLTPALIRSAVKLGMPAQAVLKIVGKDAFAKAIKPN